MTPRSAAENVALSLSATSERLCDRSGHARFGRRTGALADEALAPASPGRSESPGTAPVDADLTTGTLVREPVT